MTDLTHLESVLDPATLRTSGALLSTQTSLGRLIQTEAVSPTEQDPTIVDLLVRLDQAPEFRLRAIELSRQLLMSPSHVSRMLDRAEAAGLVEREPDPADRRAARVAITKRGREVLVEFAPRLESIIDRVISQTLSPKEADQLVELLSRIEAAASEPLQEESP
jgi:DNA-binding MarR family transcriptional regulator